MGFIEDELRRLRERIKAFEESFAPYLRLPRIELPEIRLPEQFIQPLADVAETATDVIVTVELPGMKKEDIVLEATEDSLKIKAERKAAIEEKRRGFYRAERRYKGFYRQLTLPTKVIPEKAEATYEDGVLTVKLPKKVKKVVKAKKIAIKAK